MSATRAHWFPAIPIAGAVGGAVQALPVASFECCCGPWLLVAGLAAVYAIVHRARARMEPAEGALVGLLTGSVAGVVGGVLGALRQLIGQTTGFIVPFLRDRHELFGFAIGQYLFAAAVVFALYLLFSPVLAALGGLLGAAIARPPPTPPPHGGRA